LILVELGYRLADIGVFDVGDEPIDEGQFVFMPDLRVFDGAHRHTMFGLRCVGDIECGIGFGDLAQDEGPIRAAQRVAERTGRTRCIDHEILEQLKQGFGDFVGKDAVGHRKAFVDPCLRFDLVIDERLIGVPRTKRFDRRVNAP